MYADSGRLADLKDMMDEMNDISRPMINRRFAYKAYKAIMRQLKDKQLAHMRERLIKASDKMDRYEVWKIRNQIKDYMGEERLHERSY